MSRSRKLFGWHAVEAATKYTPEKIINVWLDSSQKNKRSQQFQRLLSELSVAVHWIDKRQLEKLSGRGNHQGVVMEVDLPSELGEKDLECAVNHSKDNPFFLILDQIQDPQNLGACLRTADATGVQGIIITKDRSVGLSPTVYKVASGAVETVPLYRVTNLVRTMEWVKTQNIWLVGADSSAQQTVFESDLNVPLAIVVGSEGKGLRRLTRERCDFLVKLPMSGQCESLNLSVATGVLLYEAVRQRR